jgi:hypothetical protein
MGGMEKIVLHLVPSSECCFINEAAGTLPELKPFRPKASS